MTYHLIYNAEEIEYEDHEDLADRLVLIVNRWVKSAACISPDLRDMCPSTADDICEVCSHWFIAEEFLLEPPMLPLDLCLPRTETTEEVNIKAWQG